MMKAVLCAAHQMFTHFLLEHVAEREIKKLLQATQKKFLKAI